MQLNKISQGLTLLAATFGLLGALLFFKQSPHPLHTPPYPFLVQNTNDYLGPQSPLPGHPELVRVQILIHDDPNPQGVKIESVRFNGKDLSLKPSDIHGFRGQSSFQVPPHTYSLKWVVRKNAHAWPRTMTHEEEVQVDGRDFWIQINIVGDRATID